MNNKIIRYCSLALVLLIIGSCAPTDNYQDVPIEVTLVQLNDVYEIAPLDGGKVGGMARVGHIIREEKQQNPNTYAVVAGDFLSPSLLGTLKYEGDRIKGMQMIEVFNAAGIDYVTFGNHEFDLSRDELQERMYDSEFEYISSNVYQRIGDKEVPFQQMENGKIVDVPKFNRLSISDSLGRKVTLGMLGVTLPFNQQDYVGYRPVKATMAVMVDSLQDAHSIVALTHLDIKDDTSYAHAFPSISLMMGGHDHENMIYDINGTTVAKADANAKTVYIHRLKIYMDGRVTVKSELKPVTDEVPEDAKTKKVVNKWLEVQQAVFEKMDIDPDEVLMTAPEEGLEGREAIIRNQPTNLGKLIAHALMYAAPEADAAILNSGSVRVDDVLSGDITQFDVMRTLPFGGSILEVEIRGSLLEKVLQIGRENKGSGGFLQWANVSVDSRRNQWKIGGEVIQPDKTYRIAMPEFLMTGGESNLGFLTPDNKEIKQVIRPGAEDDLKEDIRYAVIEYMKEKK